MKNIVLGLLVVVSLGLVYQNINQRKMYNKLINETNENTMEGFQRFIIKDWGSDYKITDVFGNQGNYYSVYDGDYIYYYYYTGTTFKFIKTDRNTNKPKPNCEKIEEW
jgi:hypothetical protein